MIFLNYFPGRANAQVQPIIEAQEMLENVSDEEKAILKELFALMQEIEMLEKEEEEIIAEIESVQDEIDSLEEMIDIRQKEYDKQLEVLKQFLQSYQKKGPASFLAALLSAGDLTTYVRSRNIIKDLSHSTRELMDFLEEEKKQLEEQKEVLRLKKEHLEKKKQELQESIAKKLQLKNELEERLNSLKDKKEYYEEKLNYLKKQWDEIKDLFSNIVGEFTRIVEEEGLPIEELNLNISFSGIKGIIYEETFSNILKEHSDFPAIEFKFHTDKVIIEVPEKNLTLEGKFVIENQSILKFEVNSGTFYNMPLEDAALKELFSNGSLFIDFSNFMDDIKINSIKIKNGYAEFDVAFDLKLILDQLFK